MMDDLQATTLSTNYSSEKSFRLPNLTTFASNFPKKLQECFEKLHFKPVKRDDFSTNSEFSTNRKYELTNSELSLEKQLHAWRENPVWVDHPPEIKVTVPKGSLCNVHLKVNIGLPPDAVYNIVTDPDNKRVFKNIKEVISRKVLFEEGFRQVVEVDQAAIWRFLWWSGTFSVHVLVDQNRQDYTMKFKQVKSGFMQRFEGCWKIEPIYIDETSKSPSDYISGTKNIGRIGSRLSLEQLIEPSIVPPPPISWYLRGITTKTTETLIHDLVAEAARIRRDSCDEKTDLSLVECKVGGRCSIKERWAVRRRHVRGYRRKMSLNSKSC